MALETLITHLGGSVARLLFKFYLGDFGEEVGSTFTDLAANRLQSKLDQRRAARAFEEISEQVLSRLVPLFESNTDRYNLNADAVAFELEQTLSSRSTLDDLLASDLDPARLSALLRSARPLDRKLFSDAEVSLYHRALEELVRYLVDTAELLPRFDARVAGASLQRLTRIAKDLGQALATTERIERRVMGALGDPQKAFSRYEADYREAVVRELDKLELFGVDISEEARRYPLTVAYIGLNLKTEFKRVQGISTRAEAVFDQMDEVAGRLLIRGEAGSGKTTLLRWAAIQAAGFLTQEAMSPSWRDLGFVGHSGGSNRASDQGTGLDLSLETEAGVPPEGSMDTLAIGTIESDFRVVASRDAPLPRWRSRIPFFLPLRNCPNGILPTPDELPGVIARLEGTPPANWVRTVLETGQGLLLLDGVDEMPRKKRHDFKNNVRSIVSRYPRNMFIVSARPSAVSSSWLSDLNFREATVDPMSAVDQAEFIERWHIAVGRTLADFGRTEKRLPALAKALIDRVRERPSLGRLATNPLLCAMICALHRDRNELIPSSEPALCDAACAMLLHRREQESDLRQVEDSIEYQSLSYEEKRFLVRQLAWYMVRNGYSRVERHDAENRLLEGLRQFVGKSQYDPGGILLGLIERSGMLREESPGSVDFIHNTLKEYLAAEQFVQQNDAGMLAKNYRDASWRPVILFAVATNQQGFANDVIRGILRESTQPDEFGRYSASFRERNFFVLRCRVASLVLPSDLQVRLEELVPGIFPPRNFEEASDLAVIVGAAATGQLRFQPSLTSDEAAASIRTLRLIGTSLATEVLAGYRSDRRLPVVSELARAINPLEIDLVREILVESGTILNEVRKQIDDLSPLSGLALPPELDLHGTSVTDISVLTEFTMTRKLNLSGAPVRDIGPLSSLEMMQELDLSGLPITNIEPLACLTELRTLYLDRTHVSDLYALRELPLLQTLSLVGTPVRVLAPVLPMMHKNDRRIVLASGRELRNRPQPLPHV